MHFGMNIGVRDSSHRDTMASLHRAAMGQVAKMGDFRLNTNVK